MIAGALIVADATGLLSDCDESCVDDTDGKQCPPVCPTCTCAGHTARLAIPLAEVVTIVPARESCVVVSPVPANVRGRLAPPPLIRPPIA